MLAPCLLAAEFKHTKKPAHPQASSTTFLNRGIGVVHPLFVVLSIPIF